MRAIAASINLTRPLSSSCSISIIPIGPPSLGMPRSSMGGKNPLFLKMMALVGKMTEEIQRLLPTVQGLLHASSCELLQHDKHTLDDSVLITEQFRSFLGTMMRTTAWSLGHVRCVNTLRLICFNSIFHNFLLL